jgi:hypothetical protein
MDDRASIPGKGTGISLCPTFRQAISASYQKNIERLLLKIKRPKCDADHSTESSVKVKNA